MKGITLMVIALILLSSSCAQTVQEQSRGLERPLMLQSSVLQEQYELFTVSSMKMPIADNSYILAKDGDHEGN